MPDAVPSVSIVDALGRIVGPHYVIGPGDALGIFVYRAPELSVDLPVRPDGRVENCRVTRSSGVPLLDTTTCRLIVTRFRYRPSRDTAGRPVEADIVENHEWVNEMTEADLNPPPERVVRRRRWF